MIAQSYTVHKHCSFHCSYQQWNGGFALELYTKGLSFVLCSRSFTLTAQPGTNASFYFRFGLGYRRSMKRRYQLYRSSSQI
ncbi:hypothetical protein RchiOBHm_Chr4g0427601 [Rosa chinensis]|uniref:Uncharacterized protein n=1 Tax=Rosa chinensis TaxID=74649 RepID=A0A2P6QZP4_ROSCH|nr:hypothetical protein RchiOBHm_Chr4g0427601 [Rosa chinensis]